MNNPPAVVIQKTNITSNGANGGFGGGAYISWAGNTTANKPVQIQSAAVNANNSKFNGGGIYLGVGAHTKFGAGVTVNNNKSNQKEGISIYQKNANVDGRDNVEEKNNQYLPPAGGDGNIPSAHYVDPDSTFDFAAVVDMTPGDPGPDGSVAAITFRNAGTVTPAGDGAIGLITLIGSYDQTGTGALKIDLGGNGQNPPAAGTDYDQIHVTATGTLVSLAGALALNPVWSAPPAIGTKFIIIQNDTAAATSGTFDGLPDGTIIAVAGVGLRITYNRPPDDGNGNLQDPNDVVLEVIPAVLTGFVWDDGFDYSDGSGTWDEDGVIFTPEGGRGLAGIPVHLLNADGVEIDSTTTDANGYYRFSVGVAGQYRVKVDRPAGDPTNTYAFTAEHQGGDTQEDSDVDAGGYTDLFVIDVGGFVERDAGIIDHIQYG